MNEHNITRGSLTLIKDLPFKAVQLLSKQNG